jgi:hypothetical protein
MLTVFRFALVVVRVVVRILSLVLVSSVLSVLLGETRRLNFNVDLDGCSSYAVHG